MPQHEPEFLTSHLSLRSWSGSPSSVSGPPTSLCSTHRALFFPCSNPAPLTLLFFLRSFSHFFVLTTQDHFFSWQFLQNMNAYEAVDLFFFQDIYPTLYQGKIICFWYYLCTFAKIPCCLSLSPGTECALEYMLVHLLSHSADKRHLFKRWFILS